MELSVVIVNYNNDRVLRGCLQSLSSGLDGIDAEVIISDNGSTDGSIEWVRKNFPRIRIHENGVNLGFAEANYRALPLTNGDHILLLLWLQGRKSAVLDPADTNADGLVDAADALQFVEQFAAGSQLANYTGYQNPKQNDPLDNGDLTAYANRLAVVVGGN